MSEGSEGILSAPQSETTLPSKPRLPRAHVAKRWGFSQDAVPLMAAYEHIMPRGLDSVMAMRNCSKYTW